MGSPGLSCNSHRGAAAGWRCTQCERLLCPACTAQKRAQTVFYPVCTSCGGAAVQLKVHRAERSYLERIKDAWRYPLSPAGLFTMAAAGLVIYLLSLIGQRGVAIGVAILWSYVFTLIRRTANGDDSLDPPDFTDFSDVATPGFRGALATAVLWVPAALYLHFGAPASEPLDALMQATEPEVASHFAGGAAEHAGGLLDTQAAKARALEEARRVMGDESERLTAYAEQDDAPELEEGDGEEAAPREPAAELSEEEQAQAAAAAAERAEALAQARARAERPAWKDPVLWLLVLFGVLWMPVAILSSAAGGSALEMLNPLRPVGLALRIPREYGVAVGACFVLALAWVLLALVSRLVTTLLPIPLISGWAETAVSCYVPLVAGRVLGMLLYVRGADIGYSREEEAYELALPGVEPQGKLPGAQAPQGAEDDGSAPSEQPAPPTRQRPAPIELDEEPNPAAAAHALAMAATGATARAPAPQRVMGLQGLESAEAQPAPGAVQAGGGAPAPAPRPVPASSAVQSPGARAASASGGPAQGSRPAQPPGTAPAPASAPAGRSAAEALQRAVQAQDLAQALQVYPAAAREPGAVLPAACHHAVGRHAASQGQYPLAVQALRAACAVEPAGPLAASSLVLMARLLQERMGDAAGAQRVYAHVVQHYAGSEAARFAQGRLPPRAG